MCRRRYPTGSALDRVEHCPASQALPHVYQTTADGASGTARHRFLELVGGGATVEGALQLVPEEYREACEAIDLTGLPLVDAQQEVAYAYDLATGRVRRLEGTSHRDYSSCLEREIPGTIDVVVQEVDGSGGVIDYKFDGFDPTCPPASENPQLLLSALCLSRVRGWGQTSGTLIHFRSDGSHWSDSAVYDALALDLFESRLQAIAQRVDEAHAVVAAGKTPDVSRGEWCAYCPVQTCPALAGIIRAAAEAPSATVDDLFSTLNQLTPASVAKAYRRRRELGEALKRFDTAMYLFASEHDVDLGDGQVYGAVRSDRKVIDARVARRVLAERFGPEVAEAACEFETSQAAIGRALRPVVAAAKKEGQKVTAKSVGEAALKAIAAAGGVRVESKVSVREHRSRELPSADAEPRDALALVSEGT